LLEKSRVVQATDSVADGKRTLMFLSRWWASKIWES
jgi:hypothetical protein